MINQGSEYDFKEYIKSTRELKEEVDKEEALPKFLKDRLLEYNHMWFNAQLKWRKRESDIVEANKTIKRLERELEDVRAILAKKRRAPSAKRPPGIPYSKKPRPENNLDEEEKAMNKLKVKKPITTTSKIERESKAANSVRVITKTTKVVSTEQSGPVTAFVRKPNQS